MVGVTVLPSLNYAVSHYGRDYSVISEKSKCNMLRFDTSIESRYGGNRFMVEVLERNENYLMTPTIHISSWPP